MTTLVIVAVCFLALGVALWAAAISALGNKRWVSGALRGVLGLLFFALAALAGAITIGIQGYRALTYEEVAATVKTEPVAPQRFRATITLPNQRLAMYELAGDARAVRSTAARLDAGPSRPPPGARSADAARCGGEPRQRAAAPAGHPTQPGAAAPAAAG